MLPEIDDGVAGAALTVTDKVCEEDVPQLLIAVTLSVPAEPAVALIVLLVLVPLHPPGNVQPYEVAPLTVATL